jgi:hypothetical protein
VIYLVTNVKQLQKTAHHWGATTAHTNSSERVTLIYKFPAKEPQGSSPLTQNTNVQHWELILNQFNPDHIPTI